MIGIDLPIKPQMDKIRSFSISKLTKNKNFFLNKSLKETPLV